MEDPEKNSVCQRAYTIFLSHLVHPIHNEISIIKCTLKRGVGIAMYQTII